ncbi:hypothetical protein D5018_00595 [Parashewanella curva]|uniref:Uncharacterized protein n=1 Tax=Parashewanella curva TaxID=2338552 RepID=A0A3L8Q2B6_9GAMM|nr:hypothetical protein [Parashewanella curva]RLV61650.1 hypothetical protein D5018_00595 [Parashewanella curva]
MAVGQSLASDIAAKATLIYDGIQSHPLDIGTDFFREMRMGANCYQLKFNGSRIPLSVIPDRDEQGCCPFKRYFKRDELRVSQKITKAFCNIQHEKELEQLRATLDLRQSEPEVKSETNAKKTLFL